MALIGPVICRDCGDMMTQQDIEYFEYRCETCEREWMIRIEEWRHGAEDKEIDRMFYFAATCRRVH